jgi:hypothetical protein
VPHNTKAVEKVFYMGDTSPFKNWQGFKWELKAQEVMIAFTALIAIFVILTDNLFNTYVVQIVPAKMGMLKLYAISWASVAIALGLMLPFIIRSGFSYLALFGGLTTAMHLIDLKFLTRYFTTLPPQKWIDIIIAVIAALLTIGYIALILKIRKEIKKRQLLLELNRAKRAYGNI